MADCKYCGAEGLRWQEVNTYWNLVEPDGNCHNCSQSDRKKYKEQLEKENAQKKEAACKHRQDNGYLA